MLCEKCKKKEATVFYEETINGKSRSYSLCGECVQDMKKSGELYLHGGFGDNLFGSSSFGGIADNLFGGLFGIPEGTRTSRKICPNCHASFEDIRRSGKAGCPICYHTFAPELRDTVRSIHGNAKHIGKTPANFRAKNENKARLEELKASLKRAIAEENFEQAAELRDRLRTIENENERRNTHGLV